MKRARLADHQSEPSLVPLADMLTNTVGIMLFILIFTVLATAGASVNRHFPIEHDSAKGAVFIYCAYGKIYPVNMGELAVQTFMPANNGSFNLGAMQRTIATADFDMQGRLGLGSNGLSFAVYFLPKPEGGETVADAKARNDRLDELLANEDPGKRFVFFFVAPDSLDAFETARDKAIKRGFEYGWTPRIPSDRIGIVMFGSGIGSNARPE